MSWVPLVMVLLLPWMLLFGRNYQVGDPDTFWHIRAGEFLMATWQFSGPDPWSPFSSNPWVLHEWLPEVGLALANRAAGLGGVAWLWYAGTCTLALTLLAACRRHSPRVVAILATVLGLLGMWASLSPRPQLVTFALAAATTSSWLSATRTGRRAWWMLPVTWVWACSHGMWFVGPLIGLAVVGGMALHQEHRHRSRRLLPIPLLSIAAAALTPAGPALLLSPLAVSGYTRFVSEWDPPRLSSPPVAATLLMLLVVMGIWLRSTRRPGAGLILLWILALGWTLAYVRTVAVGAAIAAPLLAYVVDVALAGRSPGLARSAGRDRREAIMVVISAVASLVLAVVMLPPVNREAARMPLGLDPMLNALPRGTVVMNEYGFGGWLRYAHPDLVPVIDERTEVFSIPYVSAYLDARLRKPGWGDFLVQTKASAALVPTDSPIADALLHDRNWRSAGEAEGLSLLVSPAP